MLRINELKLPLHHSDADFTTAVLTRLEIAPEALLETRIFKRSYDARKKSNILLIYQLDVTLTGAAEQQVLAALESSPSKRGVRLSPDTNYKLPVKVDTNFPSTEQQRPVVIGFGPCGILAALSLAQMGLKPIVLERGKDVRQRTKDTWGLWRKR